MVRKITETTDGQFIGITFDDKKPFKAPNGEIIRFDVIQKLGDGLIRYSNSNYTILTKGK